MKGQTLRLRLPGRPRLTRIVRGWVKGVPIYLVPRADGTIIVGASVEERGFDTEPRAGAVYELLRDAQSLMPELGEAVLEEISTGLRPGSPDNAPILGPSGVDGLIHATGHYRNGILLAPVTADGIAALITEGTLPDELTAFSMARFAAVALMQLRVNGKPHEAPDGTTVDALIVALTGSARGSAAVVDGEVVPRSAWVATALQDGQSVELITAVQGG